MSAMYDRVALIGLGLIAGSMAHAMRRGGLAGEIVGTARSAESRAVAREIGLVDRVVETAAEAAAGADLVVLAVPVGAMGAVAEEIAPALKPGATLTDVGSVKRAVIEAVAPPVPDGVPFVPAPPLAGTEHYGPRSGFGQLVDGRPCRRVPSAGAGPGDAVGGPQGGHGRRGTRPPARPPARGEERPGRRCSGRHDPCRRG